jgi:cytochrome P450
MPTALADLDLPQLAMDDPAFGADPLPHMAAARAKHPWLAKSPYGYVLTEYTAMRDVMRMDDKLRMSFDGIIDALDQQGTPWGRFLQEQIMAAPDAEHATLRALFAPRFTPRYANQMRGVMREAIATLLDEWVPKRRIDFEEFASYFPVSVIFRLVGAPVEEIPKLRWALEIHGLALSMDPAILPKVNEAVEVEDAFVHRLMTERRARGPRREGESEDLLDLMMEAAQEGAITDRQLADMLIFLFEAGYDTSKNVLTYMMHLMLDHPDLYERCAVDIDFCRKCVEETLRYYNPGTSFRFTDQDLVYRDVLLPKDTMLFFPLSVSGQDEGSFEEPRRFDPDRPVDPNKRHIAFGMGKHICLGQFIARAQLQEALHLIAQRMRNPRRAGEPGWRPFYGVWGIKGLPIEFTPAEAAPRPEEAAPAQAV